VVPWHHSTGRHQTSYRKHFLSNFVPPKDEDWSELIIGRLGRLRLRGSKGSLDPYVVYNFSGSSAPSLAARHNLATVLERELASPHETRSLFFWDFNSVEDTKDRWCKRSATWTGQHEDNEAERFRDAVLARHSLHELQQPHMTHENNIARSRIDRAYSNHHILEQLDRAFPCVALEPNPYSAHRPISFSRHSRKNGDNDTPSLPNTIIEHPDWPRRVSLDYIERMACDDCDGGAARRLVLLKRSINSVTKSMRKEGAVGVATQIHDQLGWVISFSRAAEEVNLGRMAHTLRRKILSTQEIPRPAPVPAWPYANMPSS